MKILIVITLGLSLLLTACVPNAGTFTDPGSKVIVKNGSRFTIELPSNVTTGYSWEYGVPVDTNHLKLVKTYYNESQSDLVGAGGTQGWIFEAVQPGATSIALEYKRPWEVTEPPNQTALFQIEIK
jgi:inhibitor of cysteine peptidase